MSIAEHKKEGHHREERVKRGMHERRMLSRNESDPLDEANTPGGPRPGADTLVTGAPRAAAIIKDIQGI